MKKVNLPAYQNSGYQPGNGFKIKLWYIVNAFFLLSSIPWPQILKVLLLKTFGAKIGRGFVIKPRVSIKYPWFLHVGDNVWIGEAVWIDNLCDVSIGDNVCLSQGVYMTTGNHDYKKETFDLLVQPIKIENGVWIGAQSIILPGALLRDHSVIMAGSVIGGTAESYTVYRGNPAQIVRARHVN